MTFPTAIRRVKAIRDYREQTRIEREASGRTFHNQVWDVEALDLALSALQFAYDTEEYEKAIKEL